MKLSIVFSLFLIYSYISAQEFLSTTEYNSRLFSNKYKSLINYRQSSTDTLGLPFFDDFSYDSDYPSNNRWIDSNAFVNRNFPINAPTIGVVTLDGLNKYGLAYGNTAYQYGPADSLTSKPIKLDTFNIADSLYLSFHYQAGGNGDEPDEEDSLVLEFFMKDSSWLSVWSSNVDTFIYNNEFNLVKLPLLDSGYYHNAFQFRFRNYATISGNNDHWNLDFIFLEEGKSINDTAHYELAIKDFSKSILSPYFNMPCSHFTSTHLVDSLHMVVTNLHNTNFGADYDYKLIDISDNSVLNSNGLLTTPGFQNDYVLGFEQPDISGLMVNNDSLELKIQFEIYKQGTVFPSNDTAGFDQLFYNYFSYDDGSAEKGYGLISTGAQLAVAYDLSHEDTLWGVFFHWAQIESSKENELFTLSIWNDIDYNNDGSTQDSIIYQEDFLTPTYVDSLNGWSYYALDPQIVKEYTQDTTFLLVSGRIYVGWAQTTSEVLNVGFDANTNNKDKVYFSASGYWENSQFQGSLMIRPVVGKKQILASSVIEPLTKNELMKFWPNPADHFLFIQNRGKQTFAFIYDKLGQRVMACTLKKGYNKIDISQLSPGIYFLNIEMKSGTQKFFKY
ncbi:MAG TPA: T9SS type A sorting domain-containing protein [Bacteroidetes bacterium]|nr:T9SS type A sorting domain-containing protein [Bacteroidota bacterium]